MKGFVKLKPFLIFALVFMSLFAVLAFSASAEDTVESIEIKKVTLIENYDGETVVEEEEEEEVEYFRYYTEYPQEVTVTMSSGKQITDSLWALEMYFEDEAVFQDSQSADNPWEVGSYKVSYSFLGISGEYDVEIIETPVEKITVENMELYYLADGEKDDFISASGSFYYYSAPKEMTVYFKDGSVLSGTADSFYEMTGYFVDVYDTQDSTPWGIGKYKCRVNYMGVWADYYVTVKASDVKSIMVEDIELYEGIDGYWSSALWDDSDDTDVFYYDAVPEKVTVFYKNGSALTGSVEEVEKATGYEVNYDTDMEWNYGKNVASASFMGASTKFSVNVKANPIKEVKLIKAPDKTEYYASEILNLSGAVIRVYYTDGKTEDVEIKQNLNSYYTQIRLEAINRTVEIENFIEVDVNDYEIDIDFLDSFFTVELNVRQQTIDAVALSKDENSFPVLTLTLSDGSEKSVKILNTVSGNFNSLKTGESTLAVIITDIGAFGVEIDKRLEGYSLTVFSPEWDKELKTNYCDGINWAESAMSARAGIIYNCYEGVDAYNGLVASDNIDKLLSFAALGSQAGKPQEIHSDYMIYSATEIQKCVKDFFALDGIDISCSDNYNTKTNSVKIDCSYPSCSPFSYYGSEVVYPVSYSFENSCFKVTYEFTDGKKMSITADKDGRIISYKVLDAAVHKHVMITVPGTAPTYLYTGISDGVICASCGEVLTQQKKVERLILGKTDKIAASQNTSAIKLAWLPVTGATGYEVFYKTSTGWKNCATLTGTAVTFSKLPSGKKYLFAVRAYVIENGKVIKAPSYTTFETATKPATPVKAISKQSNTALQLQWASSAGATGYRVYYETSAGWKSLGETAKTVAAFKNLKAGSKYTFAIRPYIITANTVVWGDYITYTAATLPDAPAVNVSSPSSGRITLAFNKVNGAEVYQIYYKTGNGSYKLYKNVTSAGTLNFASLKSGTTYTFAIRAAIKTSGGWIFGSYKPVSVKVK